MQCTQLNGLISVKLHPQNEVILGLAPLCVWDKLINDIVDAHTGGFGMGENTTEKPI
ncbi:hypothetical protein MASR1M31_09420 [Porphyromonadaceae bacterium]